MLADALSGRSDARLPAVAAAFAEACGSGLSRHVALRGLTRDGCLIAVATTRAWADQVEALGPILRGRVNERMGGEIAKALDVRVGPLGR